MNTAALDVVRELVQGRGSQVGVVAAWVVLAAMMLASVGATLSRRIWAPWLAIVLGVVWILVNRPIEGPVLWVVGGGHGLTLYDLLTPIVLVLAATRLLRLRLARSVTTDNRRRAT